MRPGFQWWLLALGLVSSRVINIPPMCAASTNRPPHRKRSRVASASLLPPFPRVDPTDMILDLHCRFVRRVLCLPFLWSKAVVKLSNKMALIDGMFRKNQAVSCANHTRDVKTATHSILNHQAVAESGGYRSCNVLGRRLSLLKPTVISLVFVSTRQVSTAGVKARLHNCCLR